MKTILNRHSQIFAGPETGLFGFPQLYGNWEYHKYKMLKGLYTNGWALRDRVELLSDEFGWTEGKLLQAIRSSNRFPEFVDRFFSLPLERYSKCYWVEKTPINAYGFSAFLKNHPNGKAVQIVRSPYDTVASLVARGINVYWAAGYYVYNTAIATSSNPSPRYHQLAYEELAARPIPVLKKLFDFMEMPFEPHICTPSQKEKSEEVKMKGWKHSETGDIKKSSIGRFGELPGKEQALIKSALASFQINKGYLKKYGIRYKNCRELCEALGYPFLPPEKKHALVLIKYYCKDRLARIKHHRPQQFFDYPGKLKL